MVIKKILFIYLLIFIGVNQDTKAQNYTNSSTAWLNYLDYFDLYRHEVYTTVSVIDVVILEDTILHKLEAIGLDSAFNAADEFIVLDTFSYTYYLREDAQQFYYRTLLNSTEYLIYDFNLSVGDTVLNNFGDPYQDSTIIVTSIDTLEIGQLKRKRFHTNMTEYFLIEGIGSNNDFSRNPTIGNGNRLICYKSNEDIITINSEFTCTLPISTSISDPSFRNFNLSISPNPFSTTTRIEFDNKSNEKFSFHLFNTAGQLVSTTSKNASDQLEFFRNDLSPGIYFFKLIIENGFTYTDKLLIID